MEKNPPGKEKRHLTRQCESGSKKPRSKRKTASLPPSQERAISSFFPVISTTRSVQDCIANREACVQALDLSKASHVDQISAQLTPAGPSSSLHASQNETDTSTFSQISSLHTNDETPSQAATTSTEISAATSPHEQEYKNLIKILKIHLNAVDAYIARVPSEDAREQEVLMLNKYVLNMQTTSSYLQNAISSKAELKIVIDDSTREEINRQASYGKRIGRIQRMMDAASFNITTSEEHPSLTDNAAKQDHLLPPTMVKQMTELIEEKIRKAKQEIMDHRNKQSDKDPKDFHTSRETGEEAKKNIDKRNLRKLKMPPPTEELMKICLNKAKEFLTIKGHSEHVPINPSALWITPRNNQELNQLLDEAFYITLPGVVSYRPAWQGALAIKITFKYKEQISSGKDIFMHNISKLPEDTKALIHVGIPSYGAWTLFDIRTEFKSIEFWEELMSTTNLNDPDAIDKLVSEICQWNQGALWERDIYKPYMVHEKNNLKSSALHLTVGPMTFDYYKVLKSKNKATLKVGNDKLKITPIFTPYICWNCYAHDHLSNACNATKILRSRKELHCDLCQREKMVNVKHRAATKGCPIFDAWASELQKKSTFFMGGY